jgi:quercetin dioxygenase-like cupin family protein
MIVLKPEPLAGAYAMSTLPELAAAPDGDGGVCRVLAGRVRLAAGRRSPEAGRRTSARHEIGYVVRGCLRVDTAAGSHIVAAGDMLAMSPAEPHSTTALEDSELFFVLLGPTALPPA